VTTVPKPRERNRWREFASLFQPAMLPVLAWLLLLLVMVVTPSLLAPLSPSEMNAIDRLQGPSDTYLLGTDEYGRSLLSRVVYGGRLTLLIALGSIALATVIGVPLGTLAGYYEGVLGTVIMRFQDSLLSIPGILLAILLVGSFGPSVLVLIITIAALYLPRFARLQYGSVLMIKERSFVEASRACGAHDAWLLWRTILPNTIPPLIVQATLGIAVAMLIEAGLSYMGLGIQPPAATWGLMLKTSQTYVRLAPHYVLIPGLFLFFSILSFNLLGDWLRDKLDPRAR
jgi:peptide/nickel transport system permease protein